MVAWWHCELDLHTWNHHTLVFLHSLDSIVSSQFRNLNNNYIAPSKQGCSLAVHLDDVVKGVDSESSRCSGAANVRPGVISLLPKVRNTHHTLSKQDHLHQPVTRVLCHELVWSKGENAPCIISSCNVCCLSWLLLSTPLTLSMVGVGTSSSKACLLLPPFHQRNPRWNTCER